MVWAQHLRWLMHFHYSNENRGTGENTEPIGSAVWAGRAWFHTDRSFNRRFLKCISAEWYLFHTTKSFSCMVTFGSGDGNDLRFNIALPFLFNLYLSFENVLFNKFNDHDKSKDIGIKMWDWTLTIAFWTRGEWGSWSTRDAWWIHPIRLNIKELICGYNKHFETDHTEWKEIHIPMPEGVYTGQIQMCTGHWKNRFRTLKIRKSRIKVEKGIPYPGKGENAWDCGEDGTYELYCSANSEEEAICNMIESVMGCRVRYGGGVNWRPSKSTI